MSLDSDLSRRFDLLRTLLIAGLVVLHVPPAVDIPFVQSLVVGPAVVTKIFLGNVLFRGTVPVLGVISGFLLFRRRDRDHWTLVQRKARTLLVPFLAWNIPVVLALSAVTLLQLSDYHFRADLATFDGMVDALFGLRGLPVNLPLGYLRDIFLVALFAPVLRWFLDNAAWLGFGLLAVEAYVWPLQPLFLRPEIPLFMYFGGLMATGRLSARMFDRGWAWWVAFTLGSAVATTAALVWLGPDIHGGAPARWLVHAFRWTAVPGFLALSFGLEPTRFGGHLVWASRWAFVTFCSHVPILGAMWVVLHRVAVAFDTWGYIAFGAIGPIAAVGAAVAGFEVLRRFSPQLLAVLVGERTHMHGSAATMGPVAAVVE